MSDDRLQLGRWGEEQAVAYLKRCGMKIMDRNYRCPRGEIDIIARHRNWLVFAEVKTRRSDRFGSPQEAVGRHKQRQIVRAAQWYLQQHDIGKLQPRFDVLAVLWQSWNAAGDISHIEDAFTLSDVCG